MSPRPSLGVGDVVAYPTNRASTSDQPQSQQQSSLASNSQGYSGSLTSDTTGAEENGLVFTPPASDAGKSNGQADTNGHALPSASLPDSKNSSQESQLFQLSELAAAREKMPDLDPALSRKRMADGAVKTLSRYPLNTSPIYRAGHSRTTSAVSTTSTGSRIGELSAELRAKLSYAMVKVNHGWQSHSIDQVESLASQTSSPSSTTSTLRGRRGSSASPNMQAVGLRHQRSISNRTSPLFPTHGTSYQSNWQAVVSPTSVDGHAGFKAGTPTLAPSISIQPSRPNLNSRRNSTPRLTPSLLSHSHSQHASPHSPALAYPHAASASNSLHGTPTLGPLGTPNMDPILYAPHQNVREQDAIESLLFMSSPGNSANLKHTFPSSSQPAPSSASPNEAKAVVASPRTALPSSQGRKSLPSGRPAHLSSSQPAKRVGFQKSPGAASHMDLDDIYGTPHAARTPRRGAGRTNGHDIGPSSTHTKVPLSVPVGLSGSSRPRRVFRESDIDLMLDQVAAAQDDSSDSEGEIQIPLSRIRREGADAVGA